jgi:hypothetical protein
MEKYIVKFIDGNKEIYRPLFSRRSKSFKTCKSRCRDGQTGEEFFTYKGAEYINIIENSFHQVVAHGVTPEIIYVDEVYKND